MPREFTIILCDPTPNKHAFNVLGSEIMIQILLEIYRHLSMGGAFV